jgi:cell division protein FtsB
MELGTVSERLHARSKKPSKVASRSRAATRGRRPAAAKSKPPSRRAAFRKGPAKGPKARAGATKRKTAAKEPTSALTRRRRIPVALAALFALIVLGTSFPAAALFSQHGQLSSAAAQLSRLQSENRLLAEQQQQLNSKAEIERLARQNYQLVSPGQTLYDLLPPSGKSTTAAPGGPTTGDPATQPLVSPSNAPDMSPDPGLPHPASTSGAGSSATSLSSGGPGKDGTSSGQSSRQSPTSFWSRVTTTLEFWK